MKCLVKKYREHVKRNFSNYLEQIGGNNIVIGIYECKFETRKHNRGHRVEGVWVLGLVERIPERRILLIPVNDRRKEILSVLIRRYVKQGSIIHTDGWR